MQRRTRLSLLAFTAGAGLLVGGLLGSPAGAAPDDPPQSGDPRATAVAGNATDCADAGLPGEKITVGSSVDATNTYVTITGVPDDVVLTGVVVKGGPAYNVYAGDQRTDLHAPLVPSGKPAQISHWFACGSPPGQTTSPPATTTSPPTPTGPPSTSRASSPNAPPPGSSTSPAAGGQPGLPPEVGGLAETGAPVAVLASLGGLLLVAGAGLLALPALPARRRRRPIEPS